MKFFYYYTTVLLVLFCGISLFSVSAQTLTQAERTQLEQQLVKVQAEQAQAQVDLISAKQKSSSLQNDINLLNAKIKSEQLDIQAKNLTIKTLGDNINTKQGEINNLDKKIEQIKQDVENIFRQIQQSDSTSIFEILLSNDTLSQILDEASTLKSLQQQLNYLSAQLSLNKTSSTVQKEALIVKQNTAIDARYAIQQAEKTLQANQTKQKQLLSISKNNEKAYTSLVATKKKEADAINAKLFSLAGGSNPIQFGQAYKYALAAQKATGIDPAFLLAILTQESDLGTNQGTCYLTDEDTGTGKNVKTGRVFSNVMSPTRDIPPFLKITSALNINPLNTMVSCPQSVGWGGAMGPAQFIASTWMMFTNRIASSLGFSGMANPWNPEHAFMASAIYLTDLGANKVGYTAQSNAACRYYSGSPCSKSKLIKSYGTSVMSLASTIQSTEIDKLQ
jgi:membrane-bound lytic murein transglycosylase B